MLFNVVEIDVVIWFVLVIGVFMWVDVVVIVWVSVSGECVDLSGCLLF